MSTANSGAAAVPLINRQQLEAKIASGQPFKLVMAASDFGFNAKHIPGSLHFDLRHESYSALGLQDDIVVYCSNEDCAASKLLIKRLSERGYSNVSHYAGGLIDWETAGLPLEGEWAAPASSLRSPTS
jgi:rhodanese-related sulfurtransferase